VIKQYIMNTINPKYNNNSNINNKRYFNYVYYYFLYNVYHYYGLNEIRFPNSLILILLLIEFIQICI